MRPVDLRRVSLPLWLSLAANAAGLTGALAPALSAQSMVSGVHFSVDTARTRSFSTFRGRVQFADGRGRIDVSAVTRPPAHTVDGFAFGSLLAEPGDYYLFDAMGYVLVRPATRTFSTVRFAACTYRHGNVRQAWDGVFNISAPRVEPIAHGDTARLTEHGAFTIRWHLDRLVGGAIAEILARGRTLVADAPRGEIDVVRWMAVSPALATLADSVAPLDSVLQLTTVAMLSSQGGENAELNLAGVRPMNDIAIAPIDLAQLRLPAGYVETPWPTFEHVSRTPALHPQAGARWQALSATPPNERCN